jgi:hypothetical protein
MLKMQHPKLGVDYARDERMAAYMRSVGWTEVKPAAASEPKPEPAPVKRKPGRPRKTH